MDKNMLHGFSAMKKKVVTIALSDLVYIIGMCVLATCALSSAITIVIISTVDKGF